MDCLFSNVYTNAKVKFINSNQSSHGFILVKRCPSCRSETSMRDCDRNIQVNTCGQPDMRCVVYEVKHGEFVRECMDSDKYEVLESNFKQFAVCRGDECLARLPLCQVMHEYF